MKKITLIISLLLCSIVYAQTKEKVIEQPPFVAWSSSTIEIDKVVLSDTATVLYIKAFYRPKYWIKVASGSFLKGNNGKKYTLRSGVGITLDKELWMSDSGEATFQLIFPPLPQGVTSVDFSEGDVPNSYHIYGIQLKNNRLPSLALPQNAITHKVDKKTSLPDPGMITGTAILKGRLLDYRPEMISELNVNISEPIKGFSQGMPVKINSDGTFALETTIMRITPASIYLFGQSLKFFLAPGETSELIINLRELCREQSKLRKKEKPYGQAVYINGPLAGVAQELNINTLPTILSKSETMVKEVANMDANAYKAYIMGKHADLQQKIESLPYSTATKQLLLIENDMNAAQALILVSNMLTQAKLYKKEITKEQAQTYFSKLQKDLPADYFNDLKDLTSINTPKALLSDNYTYTVYTLSRIKDQLPNILGTDKGPFFDVSTAAGIYKNILDFNPLNDQQKALLASLPTSYQSIVETANTELLNKIEQNKKKTGYKINEVGEVTNEDLFASIISKFKEKVILVDFWATWCGPCRMANKAILPLKEELKNKEIVYLYLTGETSPLKLWENMIPDIHGEHFRVTDAQWKYLMSEFKISGVPTYIIVDRNGSISYKVTGFPGVDTMKTELLKALDKQ